MTAVVAGEGLGLLNTSMSQLNGAGTFGQPKVGNGVDGLFINVVNGNVVIQGQDDYVTSVGFDVAALRVYNSQGLMDDDNGDNWSLGFHRRLISPPATGQADVTLVAADGHRTVFHYSGTTLLNGVSVDTWTSTDGAGAHDTLKRVSGQWIYEEPSAGLFDTYDATGRLLSTADRDGNTLTYAYNGNLLSSVTDASGQVTNFVYSGTKLTQVSVTGQSGTAVRVRYSYDASNRLEKVKVDLLNPGDQTADSAANTYTTTYTYDGTSKRIASITQSDGSSVLLEYVQVGADYRIAKLTTSVGASGSARVTTFNYDIAARRTDVTDPQGGLTRYSYDDENRLIRVEAPAVSGVRSVSDYSYDTAGNITQVSTRVGSNETRTIRYQYDTNGNLIEVQDALGNTQRRTYNGAGQLLTETAYLTPDPDGSGTAGQPSQPLTTNYIYDGEQHLRFLVSPEGRVTEYRYNGVGQQTDVIQYNGSKYGGSTYTEPTLSSWSSGLSDKTKAQRTYYTYDFRGQMSSATRYGMLDANGEGVNDANASTTYFVYDPAGRLLQTIDPRGSQSGAPGQTYVTSFTYDGLGRLRTATDNTGQITTTAYQAATNQVISTSPQGLVTTRVYNLAGELIEQTQSKSTSNTASGTLAATTTKYEYDDLGRLRVVTDPVGLRSYVLYDARGWKVADIGAEGSLTEYFYNDAGQVTGIRRYSTPLTEAQLAMLVDANGKPTNTGIDAILGRTPTGTNNAPPQLDLNGASVGNDYAATVSSSSISAAVDSANLTLNAGGDGTTLYSATAIILNPPNGASELLSIASGSLPSGMTATYDNTRNLLTIRDNGNAARPMADFQTALRGLRYQNTATTPIQGQRHIQIVVNDGKDYSTVATSRLLVGTPPTLDLNGAAAGTSYSATYTENASAVAIVDSSALTVTDIDSSNLNGATARIINLLDPGLETLSVSVGSTGITASYNSSTGVLTLSGNKSAASYQTVLRTLKYRNTSENPTTTARTVEVSISDGDFTSNIATTTVSVVSVNDAATISGASTTATYTEDTAPVVVVNAGLTLSDVDNANLTGATITLTGRPNGSAEVLSVDVGSTGITASYNSSTGVLTLSGSSTVADYQTVLRTLKYQNTSQNPTEGIRSINLVVSDGTANSAASTTTVNVVAVNDAPTISNGSATATYTEDAVPVVVNAGLILTDVDNTTLSGATVTLTSRPNGSSEVLSVDVGGTDITASYDGNAGVLTLSGNSSVTNYQSVLRTLKYQNTSQNPIGGDRSISIVVNDGVSDSPAVATAVGVVPVNDAPTLSGVTASVAYNEDDMPVLFAAGALLDDVDSPSLSGATVTLGSRADGSSEILSIDVGSTGIVASYNASTGVLTLSGSGSIANYQVVLRTLKYQNTSQNPTAGNRSVSLVVNDGTANSAAATTTVAVVPVNDAPTISNAATTATYTEDATAVVVVNAGLTLADLDNTSLTGATISLSSRPNGTAEVLSIDVGSSGIAASYDGSTGVLTLSGTSSVANYQAVLRTLKYQNTSQNPSAGNRSISLVVNDGAVNSSPAATTVTVVPVNDAPTISNAATTATYTEDATPVMVVNTGLTLADVDNANLAGATITLTSRPNTTDELLSVDVGSTGILASYNATTGVLTLSGSKSRGSYQTVLRTLKYQNTSQNPTAGSRSISLVVNDGAANSAAAITTVNVVPVNDAATISSAAMEATYTEDAAPAVVVDAGLTLSDVDNVNLTGATVMLSDRPDGNFEILSLDVGSSGIVASYNSSTGILTLSGSSAVANYQAVLRSLKYQNTSQNPTAGSRSISLVVNDGTADSAAATTSVNVVPVNDLAIIANAQSSPTPSYVEDAAATVIVSSSLTLSDVDSTTLVGATVTLASRPNGSSERLSVDTSGTGISASYNSSTGVLTLSGSSSIANYQTVLRTLKYWNTSQNPTGGSRSVNLVVNDGVAGSSPVLVTFNVTPVNDAPTLSGATSSLTYTEDAGSVLIEQSLALADVDNANLAGATILLNSLPDGGAESLSVDLGSTGIVASYSSGLLTLSGNSSVSNYQAVLRSLRYLNSSQNPTAGPRAVTISVSDGTLDSNSVTTTINVVAVNDLTVIGNGSSGLSYTEDSPAIAINPGLTLSDVDSTQIVAARIRLVSNPDGAQEFFAGINVGTTGIVYAYDSVSGYWNLTGTASLAEYQQVLRTITYLNTSQNPTAGARAIELAVNDGSDWSETLQTIITVVPINDAPYIDLSPSDPSKQSGSVVFPLLGNSVQCLPDVIVSDVDNATLASALAVIQSPTGMDSLSVNTAGTSITASYQSSSGTLSLVGAATIAEYRQVLKTLTYTYSLGGALFLSNKRINISVSDGQLSSYANTLTVMTPALGALQGGSSSSSTQTSSIQSVGDSSPVMAAAFIGTPITSGADRLEQRIYDAAGRLVFVVVDDVDGAGARVHYVTETKYDGAGRVTKTIAYANSLRTSVELTESSVRSNLVTSSTLDRTVQSIYDKDGLLLGMVDAEGGFTEIRYDAAGRQTQSIRYGKKVTYTGTQSISTLVGQGTPTSGELSADPSLAPQNSYTLYNNKGQIAGQIDSEGYLTAFEYDSVGNKRFGIRYGGKVSYTGLEDLASLTATAIASTPSGTTATRTHEWQYDALNRVIQEIDEQGTITAYNYHPQSGFLTSVTRASGSDNERTTTNRYDALGRLTESINGIGSAALAAAGTTTAQNNVWSKYRTRNSYDLAGRLVKTTAPSSVDSAGNAVSHYIVYFYDRQNRLQYTVNASGEVKGYTYNAFGDLESVTEYANRIGNPGALTGGDAGTLTPPVSGNDRVTGTTYTLRGQVDVVTDTLGFSANSDYNAFGELAKKVWDVGETVGSSPRTDTWSYDRRGLVKDAYRDTTGTGALNYKDSYTYDVFGRQITHTDARLSVWRTGYDKLGRVVTTTDALGGGTVTGYDAFSRVLTRTDRLGNTTTYAYDDLDRSTTVTTPEGVVTKAVSNRHGQQISITLTNLNQPETTTYTYDLDGRLKTVTKPSTLGSQGQSNTESTVNGYDDSGLLTSVTDGRGIVTTYTYDAASRVVTRTIDKGTGLNTFTNQNYLNLITRYQYDAFGNSIRVADTRGIITETVFDRRGKSVAVIVDTAGLKLATEYKYDAEGRAVLVREGIQATGASGDLNIPGTWDYSGAALKTTQYVFDDLGRRKQEILDPGVGHLNITTSYDYDKAGNLTRKKDPRTDQAIYTWYTYDANNRLVHTVDALGGVTKNSYDAEARVTSVTQYATPISVTGFGAVVSATSVNPPVNTATDRTTTTIYDRDGRATFNANALGEISETRYDANGRIIETIRYELRLPVVSAANLGRVAGQTSYLLPGQALSAGQSAYSQGGQFWLTYQSDGNLVIYKLGAGAVWASGTAGSTTGRAELQANGNFVIFNASNQAIWSSGTQAHPGATLMVEEDGTLAIYNASGAEVWTVGTPDATAGKTYQKTSYTYDAAGRLISTTDAEGNTENYAYDAAGNRTQLVNKKGDSWFYAYDAAGRLIEEQAPSSEVGISDSSSTSATVTKKTAFKTTRFVYDGLGNLLSRTEGYVAQGESFTSNRVTTYGYDARGLQIKSLTSSVGVYNATIDAGASVNYTGRNEISGALETRTVYDERGQAIANRDVGGNFSYKIYDLAGRVVYEIDAERYLTTYSYDANGNVTAQTRYAARVVDDSNGSSDADRSALINYELAAFVSNPLDVSARSQALQAQLLLKTRADTLVTNASSPKRVIKTQYDKLDRNKTVSQPAVAYYIADASVARANASPTTEYQYDTFGDVVMQRTARQASTSGSTTTVSEWITTYFGYDNAGRQTHQVDALGYYTKIDYDAYGRVSQRSEYAKPLSTIPTSLPDFAALPPPVTTGPSSNDSAGYDRILQYRYDRMDRVTQELIADAKYAVHSGTAVVDQIGTIVNKTTAYDELGNVVAVTDASGATTITYYDKLGRTVGVREPAQTSTADSSRASVRSIYSSYAVTGNNVRVEWDSLEVWGSGDVRVTVAYQADYTTYVYAYEEGIRYPVRSNTTRRDYSSRLTFTSQQALTGATLGIGEGVNRTIQSVRVEKLVGANWVVVHDMPTSGYQPRIEIGNLPSTVATVELRYRDTGVGTSYPNTLTVARLPNAKFWVGSFTSLPEGNYEYEVVARTDSNTAVDLTAVGGTSDGRLTGAFTVNRPDDDVAWLRVDGASQSVSPLVTYIYDALGNQLLETKHAAPNVTMPTTGATPITADANDQRTYYRYDALGRVKETIDADGKFEYRSYDAYGNVAKVWSNLTDIINGANNRRQVTEVYTYDRNGRQLETLYVRRNPLNSDVIGDRYRSAFNAYGEQIARGVNVSDPNNLTSYQEFYDYDDLGRLWQTNQSGVTKAYEFDLQGNATSEVTLAGTASSSANTLPTKARLSSASLVKSQSGTGTIRSVTLYDALGRLMEKREQTFTQNSAGLFDGTASTDLALATIKQLGSATLNGFHPGTQKSETISPPGEQSETRYWTDYSVTASWSSLSALSPSDIRVIFGLTYVDGTTGTHSQNLAVADFASGGVVSWRDYDGFNGTASPPKVQNVTSITVYAQVGGKWMYVRDMAQSSAGIGISLPALQTVSVAGNAFYYRLNGSTGAFGSATVSSSAQGALRVVNPTTTAGTYEYYLDVVGTVDDFAGVTTRYRGTFTVSGGVITAFGRQTAEVVSTVRTQTTDRWGNVLSTVDPRNASWVTNYRYDHAGRMIEQLAPTVTNWLATGGSEEIRPQTINYYDIRGQLIGVKDPNGNLRRRVYDEVGQLVQEFHADGGVVTNAYDTLGRLIRSRDTKGTVTQRNYDKLDRVIRQEVLGFAVGQERYSVYTYDEQGNRTSDTNALNEMRRYRYDTRGNLVAELSPLWVSGDASKGHLSTLSDYDAYGRKTREENGVETDGSTYDFQSWSYDHFGRQIASRDLSGSTSSTYYDGFGRVIRQTQSQVNDTPSGSSTAVSTHNSDIRYVYAANGWLLQQQEWSGGSQQRLTEYRYDAAGNRISERYSEGSSVLYSDTRVQYDALGRVVQTEDDGYVQNTGYDAVGNRRRLTTRYNYTGSIYGYSASDSWYLYDSENRIVRAKATRVGGVVQNNGTEVAYDTAGNRMYERTGTGNYTLYYYNAANQLTETKVSPNTTGGNPSSQRVYDQAGRVIAYLDYGTAAGALQATRKMYYNANGWLIAQNSYKADGTADSSVRYSASISGAQGTLSAAPANGAYSSELGYYSAVGKASQYVVLVNSGSQTNTYRYKYLRFGGDYREYTQTASTTVANYKAGTSTSTFDVYGNVIGVSDPNGQTPTRTYIATSDGRYVKQVQNPGASNVRTQRYYYANGQQVGSNGTIEPGTFDLNYTPVSGAYPPSTPGMHVVRQGETLQSIALAYFGDASLYYLIADANGLSTSDTPIAGQSLTIPNRVTNINNNSSTFKPYNPGEIIGDTTPTMEYVPPPPPKKKCGGVLQIVIIVVAVVATVVTAGAAAFALYGATTLSALSVGQAVVVGALAAAAGSTASQLTAMAVGLQSGFSFSAVGRAALIGGMTAGLTTGASQILGTAAEAGGKSATYLGMSGRYASIAQATVNNSLSQGVNMALGGQEKFSWSSLAASAVTAGIMEGKTGDSKTDNLPSVKGATEGFLRDVGSSAASQMINRSVQIALDGKGKFDFAAIAADAFGNALGNSIVGAIQHSSEQNKLKDALDQAGVKYDYDENGDVRSGQRVSLGYARQLLSNGATPEQVGTIFGNSTLKDGLTTLDYATGTLSDAEASDRAVAYLNQLQAGSASSTGSREPGDIGLVINPNRDSPGGESIFGDLLSGGLGVIHGLNELYSNPLTEGLANLAYGASKVVVGGGPLKTIAYQLGKVAASSSLDQGVGYLSGQAQMAASSYVSDLATRNNLSIYVTFAGQTHVLGGEQFGDVAGLLVGSVVNTVLGGAITGVTERAGQVNNVVARGDVGRYGSQSAGSVRDGLTPDHIPSYAAVRAKVERDLGRELTPAEARALRNDTTTLVVDTQSHQDLSRTYGGRNTPTQIQSDSLNLRAATEADFAKYIPNLQSQGFSQDQINAMLQRLHQTNQQNGRY